MVGSGASMDYLIHSQLFGSLFFDYNIQGPPSVQSNEYIHLFTFGAKVAIRFWIGWIVQILSILLLLFWTFSYLCKAFINVDVIVVSERASISQ